MNRTQLIDELAGTIIMLKHGMHYRMQHLAQKLSLTKGQIEVLFAVHRQTQTTVKALATLFSLTPGAISQLVEQLVQRGLIERATASTDRRTTLLTLTAQGSALVRTLEQQRSELLKTALTGLSESELAALVQAHQKIAAALQAPNQ